jgi:hypothetical protein
LILKNIFGFSEFRIFEIEIKTTKTVPSRRFRRSSVLQGKTTRAKTEDFVVFAMYFKDNKSGRVNRTLRIDLYFSLFDGLGRKTGCRGY